MPVPDCGRVDAMDENWMKSSYCTTAANCVEVWRASSYSMATGQCVQVAQPAGRVLVRDSKDTGLGHFGVGGQAWTAFLEGTVK
jgi:hypothetical protein